VVVARSMKPAQDPTPTSPVAAPSVETKIAPVDTPEPVATQTAAPAATEAPTATAEEPQKVHHETPEHASTGTKAPTAPTASAPAGGGGCGGCVSAARSGNYSAAAAAYRGCSDAAQKAECVGLLRGKMPAAAKTAAFNGQCGQAKSIAAAGQAMGIASPDFTAALNACKGK